MAKRAEPQLRKAWRSVLNLSFVKHGEVFHGCHPFTGEIVPISDDADYRYGKACGQPYYLKADKCFAVECDMFTTAEEALA